MMDIADVPFCFSRKFNNAKSMATPMMIPPALASASLGCLERSTDRKRLDLQGQTQTAYGAFLPLC